MHCTKIVPNIKWQNTMYESLRIFLNNDDILDRFKKPDELRELRELQEKYLRFYQDKKDWLVKQYCIFINIQDKLMMRFINEPDQNQVDRLKIMTDDEILFFSWLTNLEYKDAAENIRRNGFWLNIPAPNPDEYD